MHLNHSNDRGKHISRSSRSSTSRRVARLRSWTFPDHFPWTTCRIHRVCYWPIQTSVSTSGFLRRLRRAHVRPSRYVDIGNWASLFAPLHHGSSRLEFRHRDERLDRPQNVHGRVFCYRIGSLFCPGSATDAEGRLVPFHLL